MALTEELMDQTPPQLIVAPMVALTEELMDQTPPQLIVAPMVALMEELMDQTRQLIVAPMVALRVLVILLLGNSFVLLSQVKMIIWCLIQKIVTIFTSVCLMEMAVSSHSWELVMMRELPLMMKTAGLFTRDSLFFHVNNQNIIFVGVNGKIR